MRSRHPPRPFGCNTRSLLNEPPSDQSRLALQATTTEIGGVQKALEEQMRQLMAQLVDMKALVASEIKQSVSDEVARASSRSVLDIQAALVPLTTMVAAAASLSPSPLPPPPSPDALALPPQPALGSKKSNSDPTPSASCLAPSPTSDSVVSNTRAPATTTQQEAYDKMQELLSGVSRMDRPGELSCTRRCTSQ